MDEILNQTSRFGGLWRSKNLSTYSWGNVSSGQCASGITSLTRELQFHGLATSQIGFKTLRTSWEFATSPHDMTRAVTRGCGRDMTAHCYVIPEINTWSKGIHFHLLPSSFKDRLEYWRILQLDVKTLRQRIAVGRIIQERKPTWYFYFTWHEKSADSVKDVFFFQLRNKHPIRQTVLSQIHSLWFCERIVQRMLRSIHIGFTMVVKLLPC